MCRVFALMLLFFMLGLVLSTPVVERKHRKGWSDELDFSEPAVQQLLQELGVGSGSKGDWQLDQTEEGEPVDNEPEREEDYEQLLLHHGACVHPETHHSIAVGSFDFNYETCLLCECPEGRLKCMKTC